MQIDITAAHRTVTRAIAARRDRLADSGSNDAYTRDLINILDRIVITSGRGTIVARIDDHSVLLTAARRRMACDALHAALDAAPGTVHEDSDTRVTLTIH